MESFSGTQRQHRHDDAVAPTAQSEHYESLHVRVADTSVGKGVFATKAFPEDSIIGEISGELIIDSEYGSEYCLWLGDDWHLEPNAPFRFLNHHCEPNCDWDCFLEEDENGVEQEIVYLFAIREIHPDQELTLDYSWAADVAIPCQCGAESCRGWIVCSTELDSLREKVRGDSEVAGAG